MLEQPAARRKRRFTQRAKIHARMKPKFFRTATEFRHWLQRHHGTAKELPVGFYKKSSGKPSLTWPESVDEALCYGWIDGIRKRVDEESYTIRFTPRRAGSIWSAVNTRRARTLATQRRMTPGRSLGVRGAQAEYRRTAGRRPGGCSAPAWRRRASGVRKRSSRCRPSCS